jgi:ATP-binding cassette, subfamily C, bacterial CydC
MRSGAAAPLIRFVRLAGPQRARLLAAAAAGAAATGCGVALLATSGFLLARASQHPGIVALSVAVVAVRGLSIGRGGFRYAERLLAHDVAFRVLAQARVAIWRRLAVLAPAGLPAFRSGDLLARLVGDVDATGDLFIKGLTPPLAAALAGGGAALVCVIILAPAGAVLAAGLLAGGIAVPVAGLAAVRGAARRSAPARGLLAAQAAELLAGTADLHAYGAAETAIGQLTAASRDLAALERRSAAISGLGSGLATLAAGLTIWAVLVLGVAATGTGALGRVPLAVLTLTALAAFEAVSPLPAVAIRLADTTASARRITEVLDAAAPIADPPDPPAAPEAPVTISLRDVRVRYQPDGPPALDGLSLELRPGRRVALVGPNGAGKSTVASVLFRFREIDGGTAMLNGRNLASYLADDVRQVIGGCPQEVHLFAATLRQNLTLARPAATDDDLGRVLAMVGLDGMMSGLPDGLDTLLGPGGGTLSGGQRQRIGLARALLAGPAVLVLDEPAAHLDAASRRALTRDLLAVTAGRATLLITHDLDDLDLMDEIIVLDEGRVVERGRECDLLAADGPYRRLWERQRGLS